MVKDEFDQAVSDYVGRIGDDLIVTGWVLSAVVKNTDRMSADGYIVEHSEGLPYHSQLGLLAASSDELKNAVLSQVIKEG